MVCFILPIPPSDPPRALEKSQGRIGGVPEPPPWDQIQARSAHPGKEETLNLERCHSKPQTLKGKLQGQRMMFQSHPMGSGQGPLGPPRKGSKPEPETLSCKQWAHGNTSGASRGLSVRSQDVLKYDSVKVCTSLILGARDAMRILRRSHWSDSQTDWNHGPLRKREPRVPKEP